jgi:hypothetical protein
MVLVGVVTVAARPRSDLLLTGLEGPTTLTLAARRGEEAGRMEDVSRLIRRPAAWSPQAISLLALAILPIAMVMPLEA